MSLLDVDLNIEDNTSTVHHWLEDNCGLGFRAGDIWKIISLKHGYGIVQGDHMIHPEKRCINFKIAPPFKIERCDFSIALEPSCDRLDFLPERVMGDLYIRDNKLITIFEGLPDWVNGSLDLSGCRNLMEFDARYFPLCIVKKLYLYDTVFEKLSRDKINHCLQHVDMGIGWETLHYKSNPILNLW